MKAICFKEPGGPEKLYLERVPKPEPKDGEVLLKVYATALNRADVLQVSLLIHNIKTLTTLKHDK